MAREENNNTLGNREQINTNGNSSQNYRSAVCILNVRPNKWQNSNRSILAKKVLWLHSRTVDLRVV